MNNLQWSEIDKGPLMPRSLQTAVQRAEDVVTVGVLEKRG